ncbi:MAG TPA: ATP-binding protein [Bryobacteraceae bacterium]|nr:ATP-binding protein [Bryobacteraceae bacterium]
MTGDDKLRLIAQIQEVFTPTAPIRSRDLFAGRRVQVDKVVRTILQRGEHAILYGERGVGKTSLANTLFDLLVVMGKSNYQIARVQCSDGMDFESLWRAIFRKLTTTLDDGEEMELDHAMEALGGSINSEGILHLFQLMDTPSVVIIDELDRISDRTVQSALADTIKTLSDNSADTTLILVGVADSVDELVAEHRSIVRALKQVRMPRMSIGELLEIIDKGLAQLPGLLCDPTVRERIVEYSQGLPEYTHRLAQEVAIHVVNEGRTYFIMPDLEYAIKESVDNQLETNFAAYKKAVEAPRGINFKPVLLACALASKDEHGFFYAKNVTQPLRSITGNPDFAIPAFARHLKQFSEPTRGPILERRGRQYRFIRPEMEPYVILRGLSDGIITETQLSRPSKKTSTEPGQLSLLSSYAGPGIEI